MQGMGIFKTKNRGVGADDSGLDDFSFNQCLDKCGAQYPSFDEDDTRNRTICQANCATGGLQHGINAGGGGPASSYPWGTYSSNTALMQRTLNNFLASKGAATVGADGKLGPGTCGALKWALDNGGSGFSVPGTCKSFSYDPHLAPPPPPPPPPAPTPTPVTNPVLAPTKPKMTTASMLMVGGGIAAVGVIGYAIAKKKGWIHA